MEANNIIIFKNDILTLISRLDGFWLWDVTRGMNLAMKAKTEQLAFVEALTYYQKRLQKVETELSQLENKVSLFVNSILPNED